MTHPLSSQLVYIVPQSLGAQPIYLDDASRAALVTEISQLSPDENWRVNRLGINVTPAHRLHIVGSGVAQRDVYITHNLQNGTGLVADYRPFRVEVNYTAQDISPTGFTAWGGIDSAVTYGNGGVAATGKARPLATSVTIQGAGDALNEYTPHYSCARVDIGTGYAQTAAPTGRIWLTDWNVHGPVAARPDMLNGQTIFFNNYYNGSPADSPSAAVWLVTKKGAGGSLDSGHSTANTYPIDVGLGIVGDSNAGASAMGWTKAIQIGGFGSGWKESGASYIGTGIDISDHFSYGIRMRTRLAAGTAVAIGVDADAGPVVLGGTASLDANAVLQVLGPNATVAPLILIGHTTFTQSYQVKLRNSAGQVNWGVAGSVNSYLTGTAAGDGVLSAATAGKMLHLGGTTKVITVTQDNKLGLFAVTPIVRQTGGVATADTTWSANEVTMLQTLWDMARNYGLLT